ncbi:MAG: outer membrane lipoprotein carrier protein LolA [Saprospiraceae bacterium]|nr:outer membrane lipoprotein carrier protein LolA [Saprospiraceae bacterium]
MKSVNQVLVLLFLSILSTCLPLSISAQAESSDTKARALLDKVKKLYESYGSMESGFALTLKMAEQTKEEVQKGKIFQQGGNYRVEMGKQLILSDGKAVWHKEDNIVRIMDANQKMGDAMMSPKDLMNIYQKKEYTYAISGENAESWSKKATIITFKPNSRKGEYTQIKVAIDQKTNQVVSITAFGKDQSRYKLSLEQPVANKKYAIEFFKFDKAKFPNVKVEDLRID